MLQRGNRFKVAWIPAHFAVRGKYLKLLDEDGWKVLTVWAFQSKVEERHGYFMGGVSR